jgi:cell division protein ZapA
MGTEIYIQSIDIENFMSIAKKTFNLSTRYNEFQGFNGVGKTTVLNAICWCLFGKDFYDRKKFQIFTLKDGESQYDLQPTVTIDLVCNGEKYQIKRYVTVKGANKVQSAKIEINGVNFSTKDYSVFLEEKLCINDEEFKMLSNIDYAINLPQTNLRTLIIKLVGSLSDDEMFEDSYIQEKFAPLRKNVCTVGVDILEKQISTSKTKKKNDSLEKIGAIKLEEETIKNYDYNSSVAVSLENRRNELFNIVGNYEKSFNEEKAKEKEIEKTKNELKNKYDEVDILKNSLALKNKEGQLLASELKNRFNVEIMRQKDINDVDNKIQKLEFKLDNQTQNKQELELLNKKVSIEFDSLKSKEIVVDDEYCPVCNQRYPQEKLDDILKGLKKEHDNKLQVLFDKSQDYKSKIALMEIDIENTKKEKKELEDEKIAILKKDYSSQIDNEEAKSIREEIAKKRDEFNEIKSKAKEVYETIGNLEERLKLLPQPIHVPTVENVKTELENITSKLDNYNHLQEHKKILERLKEEKDKIDKDLTALDYMQRLLVEYKAIKAERMTQKLEENFQYIKFRTKELTKEGNYVECFKVTMDDKEFAMLSGGERIKCSIDLCVGIQNLKNKKVPLLIDCMGELDKFPSFVDTQSICCRAVQKPSENNPRRNEMIGAFSEIRLRKDDK